MDTAFSSEDLKFQSDVREFISSILYGMGAFLVYDIINKRMFFGNNA